MLHAPEPPSATSSSSAASSSSASAAAVVPVPVATPATAAAAAAVAHAHAVHAQQHVQHLAHTQTAAGTAGSDDVQTRKWIDAEMSRLIRAYYLALTQAPPPPGAAWDATTAIPCSVVRYENREALFERVCKYYTCELVPAQVSGYPLLLSSILSAAAGGRLDTSSAPPSNALKSRTPKSLLEKFKFLRMTYNFILDYDKHAGTGDVPPYEVGLAQSGSAWFKLGAKAQREMLGKARTPMSARVFVLMHAVMKRLQGLRAGDAALQQASPQQQSPQQQQPLLADSLASQILGISPGMAAAAAASLSQTIVPPTAPLAQPPAATTAANLSTRSLASLVDAVERNTRAVERVSADNALVARKLDDLVAVLRDVRDTYARNSRNMYAHGA
ncbi:uncharacterized protein V1518DRAFT_393877 [Limtongia smithiae]|uniref:uncharacterized protein n=1 Tax=Limtongia smithiae TaxID=1125753 RepID=UPI0034CE3A3A